jgi:hypothetical protein
MLDIIENALEYFERKYIFNIFYCCIFMKTDETDIDQSCANIEVETSQPFSHKKVVWLRFSSQNSADLFKKGKKTIQRASITPHIFLKNKGFLKS